MTEKTKTESTALARRAIQGEIVDLDSAALYNSFVQDMLAQAHVLTPMTKIGNLPVMWKVVPSLVYIKPDPKDGEVYRDPLFCEDDEVALTKVGLRRIAQSAALNTEVVRLDSGTVPHLYEFLGRIKYRGFDAQWHSNEAPVLWDLRDASGFVTRLKNAAERKRKGGDRRAVEEIIKSQLDAARYHGYRNGASRAVNAAIREFGLRQKYTRADLQKPFVCFAMVVNPDLADEVQRRMVLAAALGESGAGALYPGIGSSASLPAAFDPLADTNEPKSHRIASGDVVPPDDEADATRRVPREVPFDETSDDQAGTAVLVSQVTKAADTDDYFITTDVGRLHTSDRDVARALHESRKAGQRIRVDLGAKRGDVTEILEVLGTGAEPKL